MTCATRLFRGWSRPGLSDQEVAAISDHKSLQMLRQYTHLRVEDLANRPDQLIGWASFGRAKLPAESSRPPPTVSHGLGRVQQ
jgi:hypothetical protein